MTISAGMPETLLEDYQLPSIPFLETSVADAEQVALTPVLGWDLYIYLPVSGLQAPATVTSLP